LSAVDQHYEKLLKVAQKFVDEHGRSLLDIPTEEIREFIRKFEFRSNSVKVIEGLIVEYSTAEQNAVLRLYCRRALSNIIAETGLSAHEVEAVEQRVIAALRDKHYLKFIKGWTVDSEGEVTSPDVFEDVSFSTAEAEFQRWLQALRFLRISYPRSAV
jgi:hypothetical protein